MKNIPTESVFAFIYNARVCRWLQACFYPCVWNTAAMRQLVAASAAIALSSVSVIVNALRLKSVGLPVGKPRTARRVCCEQKRVQYEKRLPMRLSSNVAAIAAFIPAARTTLVTCGGVTSHICCCWSAR